MSKRRKRHFTPVMWGVVTTGIDWQQVDGPHLASHHEGFHLYDTESSAVRERDVLTHPPGRSERADPTARVMRWWGDDRFNALAKERDALKKERAQLKHENERRLGLIKQIAGRRCSSRGCAYDAAKRQFSHHNGCDAALILIEFGIDPT